MTVVKEYRLTPYCKEISLTLGDILQQRPDCSSTYKTINEHLEDTISTYSYPATLRVLVDIRRMAPNLPFKLGLNPRYAAEKVDPKAVVVRE